MNDNMNETSAKEFDVITVTLPPEVLNTFSSYNNDSIAKKNIEYKYSEDSSLAEIAAYIDDTYSEHYSKNKYQATEFIIDSGLGTGFCMGNVMKYAQRYGRKGTPQDWRKDLLKVIHYAIMQLHVHDLENGSK